MSDIQNWNDSDNFSLVSPEEPWLLHAKVGVFGDSDNPVDFTGGSSSVLPDGKTQNPEDYAAFRKDLFDQGIVNYGDPYRLINTATHKNVVVISRHAKEGNETGLDIAPHAMLELGSSPDSKYVLNMRPVRGYPRAMYPAPEPQQVSESPEAPISAGPQSSTGLSDLSDAGGGPDEPTAEGGGASGASSGPSKDEPTGKNPDGSLSYSDGMNVFPDTGSYYKKLPDGSTQYYDAGTRKTTLLKPHHQLSDFTDDAGTPYKALVDTNTGEVLKRLDDPSSRAKAQTEMMRLRIVKAAQTQPAITSYVNVKNNYDSLAQNAAIPPDKRTPADDAAAIQAFGGIEHPGTGVTDADKKQAEALVPLWSKVGIHINNFLHNKANTLDAATVHEMRDAAKRALDGRQKTYNDAVDPLLKEAQRMGMAPEQVNGALGLSPSPQPSQDAQPAPTSSPMTTPVTAAGKPPVPGEVHVDKFGHKAVWQDGKWNLLP